LDWQKILSKEITPPWTPELEGEKDTNNFILYEGENLYVNGKKLPEEFHVFFEDF